MNLSSFTTITKVQHEGKKDIIMHQSIFGWCPKTHEKHSSFTSYFGPSATIKAFSSFKNTYMNNTKLYSNEICWRNTLKQVFEVITPLHQFSKLILLPSLNLNKRKKKTNIFQCFFIKVWEKTGRLWKNFFVVFWTYKMLRIVNTVNLQKSKLSTSECEYFKLSH